MPERELQTSETVNIHERGGLTPAQWVEVLNRIGKPKDEIRAKILDYGTKVISEEFADTGLHYRRFLGRRHWFEIEHLVKFDKMKTPRKFPPWPKIDWIEDRLPLEIRQFARSETMATYTLNDFLHELQRNLRYGRIRVGYFGSPVWVDCGTSIEEDGYLFWDKRSQVWEIKNVVRIAHRQYTGEFGNPPAVSEEKSLVLADKNHILKIFLLDAKQAPNPNQMSPQDLAIRLVDAARINPEKIRNRLKSRIKGLPRYLNSEMFGLLEEEI